MTNRMTLKSDLGDKLLPASLSGGEQLGRLFSYQLKVISTGREGIGRSSFIGVRTGQWARRAARCSRETASPRADGRRARVAGRRSRR